ncbi:short chain dehydrogenase [Paenibacillus sp. 1_12]|nr:short chain dehydrogenase [Paenibacillus sp. 1_12]
MSLNGKVAIVTGASRGIGRQVAIQLARSGAKVAVNYSSSRGKADEVVMTIEQFGGQAAAIQADVSKVSEVEALFSETLERFGRVDILINNAGIMENNVIADVSEEIFDRHFTLNVKGTYFACQQAMKHIAQGGTIINFSTSVSGAMLPTIVLWEFSCR